MPQIIRGGSRMRLAAEPAVEKGIADGTSDDYSQNALNMGL